MTRIYQKTFLQPQQEVDLDANASHHLARVLRARIHDEVILFNGEGGEYLGTIIYIDKKTVRVFIKEFIDKNNASPLNLYLAQGISRGEKMDYTIQKSVELGVKKIYPLLTERCNVKLDEERREKRFQHWQSIMISACEQSGRTDIPELMQPISFNQFMQQAAADWKFILAPKAKNTLSQMTIAKNASVILLIGSEGGLSENEIAEATRHDFLPLSLGPRVLRTETAAVAALSVLQFFAGDFS